MTFPSDSALRSLDPAVGILDEDQRARAAALLERILATPPDAAPAGFRAYVRPRARAGRALAWTTAVAAAAAATAAAIHVTGDSGMAYASWRATPSPVARHDLDAVVRACRDRLHDAAIPVTLAERRGDFVAVLFHRNDPDLSRSCVAYNRPGTDDVERVSWGSGGSSGPAWTPPAGRITQGPTSQYGGDRPVSFATGAVGRGVVGVTIHADGKTIAATVANGRYAAWWPGRAFPDAPAQTSGEGGPTPLLAYDVRLADGRVERDVAPALPGATRRP